MRSPPYQRLLPESSFNPVIPGGSQLRAAVCRRAGDEEELDAACQLGHSYSYYIDETYGALREKDGAPIKAVQLCLFDCEEERLRDLIRDVGEQKAGAANSGAN